MSLSLVKDSDIRYLPSGQYSLDKALAKNIDPDRPTSYIRSVVDLVLLAPARRPQTSLAQTFLLPLLEDKGRNQPDIDYAFVLRPVYFCDKGNWKNFFSDPSGLEPEKTEPKSVVLPITQ